MAEHRLTHVKNLIRPYEGILHSPIIVNIKTEPVLYEFKVEDFDSWVLEARKRNCIIDLAKIGKFIKSAKTEKTRKARSLLIAYIFFVSAKYSTGQYFWSCENPVMLSMLGISSKTLNTMLRELDAEGVLLCEKSLRFGNKKVEHEIADFQNKSVAEQQKLKKRLMNFYRFYKFHETESSNFSEKQAEQFSHALHEIRDWQVSTILDLFRIWIHAGIYTAPVQMWQDGNPNPDKFVKTPYLTGADGYSAKGITRDDYYDLSYKDKVNAFQAIMDRGNDFIEDQYYIGGVGFWIKAGLVVLDADDWQTREDIWCMLKHLGIKTSIVRTPRGGCHFYFRANKETIECLREYVQLYKAHILHNRKKSSREVKLDVLANNHFITLAGTATPNGKWYEVVSEHAPATLKKGMIAKMFNRVGVYKTSKEILNMHAIWNTAVVEEARAEGKHEEVRIYEATSGKEGNLHAARHFFDKYKKFQPNEMSVIDRARKNHGVINDGKRHITMTTIGRWFSYQNYSAETFRQINHELCSPPLPDYDIERMVRYHSLT